MNFTVLLLGADANAYYMARSYHELYNKKVDLMNSRLIGVTEFSNIINFIASPSLENEEEFLEVLNNYADDSSFEKIVLIATSDKYVRLVVEHKNRLSTKFVYNYPSLELINTLLIKDNFYAANGNELPVPKT